MQSYTLIKIIYFTVSARKDFSLYKAKKSVKISFWSVIAQTNIV